MQTNFEKSYLYLIIYLAYPNTLVLYHGPLLFMYQWRIFQDKFKIERSVTWQVVNAFSLGNTVIFCGKRLPCNHTHDSVTIDRFFNQKKRKRKCAVSILQPFSGCLDIKCHMIVYEKRLLLRPEKHDLYSFTLIICNSPMR